MYTYRRKFQAHYGNSTVTVPDRVADDQRAFASANKSFPAIRKDGHKVQVQIDAEATGLFTSGMGDLVVKSA